MIFTLSGLSPWIGALGLTASMVLFFVPAALGKFVALKTSVTPAS
jgi:hypothetical protein